MNVKPKMPQYLVDTIKILIESSKITAFTHTPSDESIPLFKKYPLIISTITRNGISCTNRQLAVFILIKQSLIVSSIF